MGWIEIDRSGQLSYFLRDPLSDLRDLCVNLWRFGVKGSNLAIDRPKTTPIGASAEATRANEKLTQRSQRSDKVLKDSTKWDGWKSIGLDNFNISFVTLFLTFATSV